MPAEVQTLVIRLFDAAATQPSVKTIRPIHQILRGTSTMLLGSLSNNVLSRFEGHLFEIIRNRDEDNPSLTLYCLAIMRVLAQSSDEGFNELSVSAYDTQELLASTQPTSAVKWKPETVKQYFAERKGQKTMQYTVLRVVWACTPTTGESLDEKLVSLALANEIIAAVPSAEIRIWREANALVSRKLEEKVQSLSTDRGLRFQARCFLVRLGGGELVSAGVVGGLRETMLTTQQIAETLRGCDMEVFACLASSDVFDENTTTTFLQRAVDFAATANADQMIETSQYLTQLVQQLQAAVYDREAVVDGAMLALDVLSCGLKIQALLRLIPNLPIEMSTGIRPYVCPRAIHQARNELIHELCSLFLKAAMRSSHQNYSAPQATLSVLLDMHAASARSIPKCAHVTLQTADTRRSLSIAQASDIQDPLTINWRNALQADIETRASSEYERLVTLFTTSCATLEARCEQVEQPLREAETLRDTLERDYTSLRNAYAELESKDIDRSVQFNALELERDQHYDALQVLRREQEELNASYQELQRRLEHTESTAKKEVAEARQSSESARLDNAAALAKKQEDLDELRKQLGYMREDLHTKENNGEDLRIKLVESETTLRAVRDEVDRLSKANKEQQATIEQATNERQSVQSSKEALETEIARIRSEKDDQDEFYKANASRFEEAAREKLVNVERDKQQTMETMTREHEDALQSLKRKLIELEDASRLRQESHVSVIAQHDFDMAEKQKKVQAQSSYYYYYFQYLVLMIYQIDRLNRKCEQKDRQITEADIMRTKLIAAMGLGSQNPQMTLPLRPSRSSEHEPESGEDPSPPTPCSADDADMQQLTAGLSFKSNGSSNQSRSGPTPKRARPSKSSKDISPAQPRFRTGTTSRTSRSAAKRQPLLSISGNSAMSKSMPLKTPSHAKDVDPNETTFDGSELFGGTP